MTPPRILTLEEYEDLYGPSSPIREPNDAPSSPSQHQNKKQKLEDTSMSSTLSGVEKGKSPQVMSMAEMSLNDAPSTSGHKTLEMGGSSRKRPPIDREFGKSPSTLDFYAEHFKLKPGDVVIFQEPRFQMQLSEEGPYRHGLKQMVHIYSDFHYFVDHGQYR